MICFSFSCFDCMMSIILFSRSLICFSVSLSLLFIPLTVFFTSVLELINFISDWVFFIFQAPCYIFHCVYHVYPNLVNMFIAHALNSLSGKLFICVSLLFQEFSFALSSESSWPAFSFRLTFSASMNLGLMLKGCSQVEASLHRCMRPESLLRGLDWTWRCTGSWCLGGGGLERGVLGWGTLRLLL